MNNTINEKGIAFSIDAIIFVLTIILMLYLMLIFFGLEANFLSEKNPSLENAIYVMDSFVKNRSEKNAFNGACIFSFAKKRIESNVIDLDFLLNEKKEKALKLGIKKLEIEFKLGEKIEVLNFINEEDCFSLERFVFINKKKAIIRGFFCE